jgi:hypothetical protein
MIDAKAETPAAANNHAADARMILRIAGECNWRCDNPFLCHVLRKTVRPGWIHQLDSRLRPGGRII